MLFQVSREHIGGIISPLLSGMFEKNITLSNFLFKEKIMENLQKLVAISSNQNGDEIINYIKNTLEGNVKELKILENKQTKNKSIIIGINTYLIESRPIILSGHLDTVSPDLGQYKTNPYLLTKKGDNFYGLGSIDMKSFTAIILDRLEELKALPFPVIACLTTDEETDVFCITDIINKLQELKIKPRFTIVGEPTSRKVVNVSNSCSDIELTFYGKACHSSMPQNGVNAICAMAKFISFIEKNQKLYKTLTSNAGVISGGEVSNKVADKACLRFDIRSSSMKEINDFNKDLVRKIDGLKREYPGLKVEMKKLLYMPPLANSDNKKIEKLAKSFSLEMGEFSGGCEAGYYTAYSGDAIIFGVGDLKLAHKPNEYVNKKEYDAYSEMFIDLLREVDKVYDISKQDYLKNNNLKK